MPARKPRRLTSAILLAAILSLPAGCGGSSPTETQYTLTIAPSSATWVFASGDPPCFEATLSPRLDVFYRWSVRPNTTAQQSAPTRFCVMGFAGEYTVEVSVNTPQGTLSAEARLTVLPANR